PPPWEGGRARDPHRLWPAGRRIAFAEREDRPASAVGRDRRVRALLRVAGPQQAEEKEEIGAKSTETRKKRGGGPASGPRPDSRCPVLRAPSSVLYSSAAGWCRLPPAY